ncbi:MAG: NAD(P)H-hydrate epimerase [Planctomycetaceae bacterium]
MQTLSCAQVREFDRRAIDDHAIPGIVLMENAGRAAALLAHDAFGAGPVAVVCGSGNNGGDGLVIARHLQNLGHEVRVLVAAAAERFGGDAACNLEVVRRAGIPLHFMPDGTPEAWRLALEGVVWVVDALLGTGAEGAPRGAVATAIEAINAASRRASTAVFAVDVPSGLDADTGVAAGPCIEAHATGTFVAFKPGLVVPEAEAFTGSVHVLDIGAPLALRRAFGLVP